MTLTLKHFIFFNVYLCIYFKREREREHEWERGRERKREKESEAGSALAAQSPMQGSISRTLRS